MLPSEIRTVLLSQHENIRALAREVYEIAQEPTSTEACDELRRAIDALHVAMIEHNHDEQRLLEEVLPVADAWGEVRRVVMDDHHRHEHGALRDALAESMRLDDWRELSICARRLIEDLFAHMEVEERVLLHANVLRDDVCVVEPFGG